MRYQPDIRTQYIAAEVYDVREDGHVDLFIPDTIIKRVEVAADLNLTPGMSVLLKTRGSAHQVIGTMPDGSEGLVDAVALLLDRVRDLESRIKNLEGTP